MNHLINEECMVKFPKYYMKTRGQSLDPATADMLGIKRIYNYTSDLDFMDSGNLEEWSNGLFNRGKGEAILIESALRVIEGNSIYVMSCIVFHTTESCNLYFLRNKDMFKRVEGFNHLLN